MAVIERLRNRLLIESLTQDFPSRLWGVQNDHFKGSESESFYFGFVQRGHCSLRDKSSGFEARLVEGMYFALNGGFEMTVDGAAILAERLRYRGLQQCGGPVESVGRQKYIDGCRSSLLVSPVRWGDACLNLLTFPARTVQTRHTHPSVRLGVVFRGTGRCVLDDGAVELAPGDCFSLNANERHGFVSGEDGLTVIAYHPDSDWGPTDEVHPMINRTIL